MTSSTSEQSLPAAASKPGGCLSSVRGRYDFASTPLGPVELWPECLQSVAAMVLANRSPMLVLWGQSRLAVYNDAFVDFGGAPAELALGRPAADLNPVLWGAILPMVEGLARGQGPSMREHVPLPINRNGFSSETFVRLTCGPVPGGKGGEGGVLVTVEDTSRWVSEGRRLRLLARLAERLHEVGATDAPDTTALCRAAVEALTAEEAEMPFALVCGLRPGDDRVQVLAKAGSAHVPREVLVAEWVPLASCGPALTTALTAGHQLAGPMLGHDLFGAPDGGAYVHALRARGRGGQGLALVCGLPLTPREQGEQLMLKAAAHQIDAAVARAEALRACRESHDEAVNLRGRLGALCAQAPTPIAILRGSDFVFEVANPAACRAFCRNQESLINRPLLQALPELEGQEFFRALSKVWRKGVTELAKETPAQVRRGPQGQLETVYFNFVYAPLHASTGEMDGIAVLAFEVTDEVLAHAEMDRLRHDAEAANRTKDEFLAMLGHELRNPLSPIVTSLQLMRMRGAEFRELSVMERQVSHLVRLVDDLLDIARITQGRIELRKEALQVGSVIRRAVEMASPLLDRKAQQLDLRISASPGLVKGDLARLSQVVSNLLTNASKFSERGTLITLTAGRVGEVMRLSVRDEGVGIAPHMLDRVFDSFVQGRQSIDRAAGGLGLGLAIVRSLVSLHGGKVYALSEGVGKGAEFVVELPLEETLAASRTSEFVANPGLAGENSSQNTRILVVDDNDDAAAMLAEALADVGYEVEVAHDGPSAMQAAKRFHPDVALLDIGLPVMDGYELAQRLRDSDRGLRLIAVTGYGQEEDRRRSREAGFAAHLVKPVNLDVLTKAMRVQS